MDRSGQKHADSDDKAKTGSCCDTVVLCRKRIRSLLEERLTKRVKSSPCCDEGKKPAAVSTSTSIKQQAAAVEEILYRKHLKEPRSGDNDPFTACTDVHDNDKLNEALSRQIEIVQGQLAKRCKKKRETHPCQLKVPELDQREQTLQQLLGIDGYRRANIVLQAIDQIGVELTCSCASGSRCGSRLKLANGSMPEPVQRLFCHTTLRTQMYFTPISQLHLISWDKCLEIAECHLHKFQEWSAKFKTKCVAVCTKKVEVEEPVTDSVDTVQLAALKTEIEEPDTVSFNEKCVI